MARQRAKREERRRAGSTRRDTQHRVGGDWTTLDLPEGIQVWQPEKGNKRIDVVPYEVGGKMESMKTSYARKGEWYWEVTFFIHASIGPNNNSYVCAAKTFDKPCPICDYRGKLGSTDVDRKMFAVLKPKERQVFLVFDHDDEEKGVQLWEVSHHNFGKLLDKRRANADEDDDHIRDFDDDRAGSTLKVEFDEESFATPDGLSKPFLKAFAIDFKARPNGLDEKLLEHGIHLDEIVKVVPYDKLKAIFLQTEDADEDDEKADKPDRPKSTGGRTGRTRQTEKKKEATADEKGIEEGSFVEHEGDKCEVRRISKDGTSLTLLDPDDEVRKAVGVDEVKLIEEEAEPEPEKEEKPEPKKRRTAKKPEPKKEPEAVEEDEDDDEWEWDDEEDED